MARRHENKAKQPIESYEHRDKRRLDNPPARLVTPQTDPDADPERKTRAYDPHRQVAAPAGPGTDDRSPTSALWQRFQACCVNCSNLNVPTSTLASTAL